MPVASADDQAVAQTAEQLPAHRLAPRGERESFVCDHLQALGRTIYYPTLRMSTEDTYRQYT
jgi:hypothetical protein